VDTEEKGGGRERGGEGGRVVDTLRGRGGERDMFTNRLDTGMHGLRQTRKDRNICCQSSLTNSSAEQLLSLLLRLARHARLG